MTTKLPNPDAALRRLSVGAALVGGGSVLGAAGILAPFLHRIGPEHLPMAFLMGALASSFAAVGWTALTSRLSPRGRAVIIWGVLPTGMACLAVLAGGGSTAALWVLVVAGEAVALMQFLGLWGLAAACFERRGARRAFPQISAMRILGAVGGAVLGLWLPGVTGAVHMVVVQSALTVVAGWTLRPLLDAEMSHGDVHSVAADRSVRALLRDRVVGSLVILAVLLSALLTLVDYTYSTLVEQRFASEIEMATFLGAIHGAVNLASLGIAGFSVRRLLRRFSAPTLLVGQLATFPLGFALFFLLPGFPTMVAFDVVARSWMEGASEPSYNATLFGVPAHLREQARSVIAGISLPLGAVLTSVLLMLFAEGRSLALLSVMGTALGIVGVAWALVVRRAHTAGLARMLARDLGGLLSDAPARWPVSPAQTTNLRRKAEAALVSEDPALRRTALEVLVAQLEPDQLGRIRVLAADPDPTVRAACVRALATAGDGPAVLRALSDSTPECLLAALGSLPAAPALAREATGRLHALLDHSSPRVAAHAAGALLALGPHEGAMATLLQLAGGSADQAAPAIEVLTRYPSPEARPALRRGLQLLRTQPAAAAALLELDAQSGSTDLVEVLDWTPRHDRLRLGRLLAARGQAVVPALLAALDDPQRRGPALELLGMLGPHAPVGPVHAMAARLAARFDHLLALRAELPPSASSLEALLDASLDASLDELARHILSAACCGEPTEIVADVLLAAGGPPAQRGLALELAEARGSHSLLGRVTPWLEAQAPAPWTGSPAARRAILSTDPDPWLRGCAAGLDTEDTAMSADTPLCLLRSVAALRTVALFDSLTIGELRLLAELMVEEHHEPGSVLAREGEHGGVVRFIVEGEIQVIRGEGEQARELARRGPGEPVGELGVLTDEPRMASLLATQPTRVLCLDRASFRAVVRERPDIGLAVIATLARAVRGA